MTDTGDAPDLATDDLADDYAAHQPDVDRVAVTKLAKDLFARVRDGQVTQDDARKQLMTACKDQDDEFAWAWLIVTSPNGDYFSNPVLSG